MAGALWVTASLMGGRRYSRFDVEDAVGPVLASKVGAVYRSQRDGARAETQALGFRLTVDRRRTSLLLRLAEQPLHRRLYWTRTRRGALYPPLAAAMGMLADLLPRNVVLDPFCGAGTIPIEIDRLAGNAVTVLASDVAADAIAATRVNARTAGTRIGLFQADITRMPVRPHSIDRVVGNPPWNRQIRWYGGRGVGAEFDQLLRADGRLVLLELGPAAETLDSRDWSALGTLRVSLRGQHPVISVYGRERQPLRLSLGDGRAVLFDESSPPLPSIAG